MASHPDFEAILISVQMFHLTISHFDLDIKCLFNIGNSHMIMCENYVVKLGLLLFVE